MKGYKIFRNDWTCRGFQYQVGQTATMMVKPIEVCVRGLHFCPRAIDCLHYYPLDDEYRYAEVEAEGEVMTLHDKCATNRLRVVRELSRDEFAALCNGVAIRYYSNGVKKDECIYKNGWRHGEYKGWHMTGEKRLECTYELDELVGRYVGWHPNGVKSIECTYVNGLRRGPYTGWHDNGTKSIECVYDDSPNYTRTEWYPNGVKSVECTYTNDRRHCAVTEWYPDGTKSSESTLQDGILHGVHTVWNKDGVKQCENNYEHGLFHGVCTTWHPDGPKTERTY